MGVKRGLRRRGFRGGGRAGGSNLIAPLAGDVCTDVADKKKKLLETGVHPCIKEAARVRLPSAKLQKGVSPAISAHYLEMSRCVNYRGAARPWCIIWPLFLSLYKHHTLTLLNTHCVYLSVTHTCTQMNPAQLFFLKR